ncbi:MAG: class I SAM-dependent methyltransferase [Pirellulaceae bacterium]
MALSRIAFTPQRSTIPAEVVQLLAAGQRRVDYFSGRQPIHVRGFVPSCYETVWHALQYLTQQNLNQGSLFCEWGSGVGIVAMMAAILGYESYGIEINTELVDAANELADEFDIPVEFINGSFVPGAAEVLLDRAFSEADGEISFDTYADRAYDDLGLDLGDFDLVFAFPWPNDEPFMKEIFGRFSGDGALYLTYGDAEDVYLYRNEQ